MDPYLLQPMLLLEQGKCGEKFVRKGSNLMRRRDKVTRSFWEQVVFIYDCWTIWTLQTRITLICNWYNWNFNCAVVKVGRVYIFYDLCVDYLFQLYAGDGKAQHPNWQHDDTHHGAKRSVNSWIIACLVKTNYQND